VRLLHQSTVVVLPTLLHLLLNIMLRESSNLIMRNGRTWVELGASVVFLIAAICCVVLSLQMLCNEYHKKSGIITFIVSDFCFFLQYSHCQLTKFDLQFSLTNIHLPNSRLATVHDIPPLSNAASIVATVISSVISQAKSVPSTATAAIPDANAIGKLIPRNCSLGTKQFCVGFSNRIECNDLPLNVSNFLPEALTSFIGDQLHDLQPLEGTLAKLTSGFVQDWLISGLVLNLVMAVVFACSLVGLPYGLFLQQLTPRLTLALRLTIGLICVVSFLVPTTILHILCSKSQGLQSNIQAKKGDVSAYYFGALFCVIVMTVLTAFTPDFIGKCVTGDWLRSFSHEF
jgi:hypothetical protein